MPVQNICEPLSVPCCYSTTFTNDDLISDNLFVNHGGNIFLFAEIYDENDRKIIPDELILTRQDFYSPPAPDGQISIRLSSFTPITGTWKVITMCCAAAPVPQGIPA